MKADSSMAAILWAMGVSLLMHSCLCSVEQTDRGCMKWTPKGANVCCEACYPGHRLVKECGLDPKDLCTPCEPGMFTVNPKHYRCDTCSQCVGAQVYMKPCTATTDTQCGCKEGLTCGDARCSFCVKTCNKGQEPAEKRSCRTCPDGTFNGQSHQMCKPWSTKCPNPDQKIVSTGDAFTDIRCENVSIGAASRPEKPDPTAAAWPLFMGLSVVLIAFGIIILTIIFSIQAKKKKMCIVAKNIWLKRKEDEKEPIPQTLIIRTPTDDPRTLIAVECSFHEAQQEQGSSSLDSRDSSEQLIA
ncbi:tumor necrosis factor receptor superfamily member 9a [Cottoperca gobio]|uniref:Tumor necrosis factor receptor superfamily member 9a n=1 Tax=Cottoperca gobio TaxID=56716 RepID=A0A6J2Q3M9_COTGO|nr:tumor necrosis factor receptor superfamily member 9-like [Cottoperca gobio]